MGSSWFPLIPLPKKRWDTEFQGTVEQLVKVSINSTSEEALSFTYYMVYKDYVEFPLIPLPKKRWVLLVGI